MRKATVGRPKLPPHEERGTKSVRVNLMLWDKATERARREGYTMQDIVREFTEAYALGKLNMPEVIKKF